MPYIGALNDESLDDLVATIASRIVANTTVAGAFQPKVATNGSIATRLGGVATEITIDQLAVDSAFESRYAMLPSNNGNIPTLFGGLPAEITRAQLAGDIAFVSRFAKAPTANGNLPTLVGGVPSEVTRDTLAQDSAFVTRYAKAPTATGNIPTRASDGSPTEITRAALATDTAFVTRYFPLPSSGASVGQVPIVTGTGPLAVGWGFASPIVNVKDYGARGDGSADDTAAIRAAIAALSTTFGGRVYFPPGNYRVTDSIVIDYGTTIEGGGWASTSINMDASMLKNMFVPGGSYPTLITFANIQLSGGASMAKATIPTGDGTVRFTSSLTAGTTYRSIGYDSSTMGNLQAGDVVRLANQPPIVCTLGTGAGVIWCAPWTPVTSFGANSTGWTVYRNGDLITGLSRLTLHNVRLTGAKRHAVVLGGDEFNWSNVAITSNVGCGLYGFGTTNVALDRVWLGAHGGPHIYSYAGTNLRATNTFCEGTSGLNVFMEYTNFQWANGLLSAGRGGGLRSEWSGRTQLTNVEVNNVGVGGTTNTVSNAGFTASYGRASISIHAGSPNSIAQIDGVALTSAAAVNLFGPGPLLDLDGTVSAQVSNLAYADSVAFPYDGKIIDVESGVSLTMRNVKGYPDSPYATVRPVLTAAFYFTGDTAGITTAPTWNYSGTVTRQWQASTDYGATWTNLSGATGTTATVPTDATFIRCRFRNTVTYGDLTHFVDVFSAASRVDAP